MARKGRNGPLGMRDAGDDDGDSPLVEDHSALRNQSDVAPEEYPLEERRAQSLVQPKKRKH